MNSYSKIINDYVENVKNELKDNLSLLLIIGSSSSDKVICNWSDIDAILVLKKYDFRLIDKIKSISNQYSVKVGTTIYTDKEFLTKKIDPKTYYHLYLLQNNQIKLQFVRDGFSIPNIIFEEIKETHIPYFYWRLHTYKRLFLYDELNKEQYRSLFKITYLIMKAKLILNGDMPKNYDEVFKLYSERFNFEYFDYETFISNYMNDNDDYKKIYEYAKKFLLSICE